MPASGNILNILLYPLVPCHGINRMTCTMTASAFLQHRRVLLVENDLETRDLLLFALKAEGAEVICTATAPEALVILESFRADVILCNLTLPGTDGYSLIRTWRAREHELGLPITPAVALSTFSNKPCRQEVLEAGYQALITQQFDVDTLVRVVAEVVGRSDSP